jgi:hypothetical protein
VELNGVAFFFADVTKDFVALEATAELFPLEGGIPVCFGLFEGVLKKEVMEACFGIVSGKRAKF